MVERRFTNKGVTAFCNYMIEYGKVLETYITEREEESETYYELDVIQLCCKYKEFKSFEDYKTSCGSNLNSIDELRDYTTVIEFDGGIMVQNY